MRMTPLLFAAMVGAAPLSGIVAPRIVTTPPEPKRHTGTKEAARRQRQMQRAAARQEPTS